MPKVSFDLSQDELNKFNKACTKLKTTNAKKMREFVEDFNKEQLYLLPDGYICKQCLSFHLFCYQIVEENSDSCICKINSFKKK